MINARFVCVSRRRLRKNSNMNTIVDFQTISEVASSTGLNSDYLRTVCHLIEKTETAEKTKLKLIECLIPERNGGTIPEDVCIKLSSLLKSSKISLVIKVELLKYMISAHSLMEMDHQWHMLYEMFFGLLKNKEMQVYIAQLLSVITHKKHVTYRRLKCLHAFIDEHGKQPAFTMLLRVFFFHGAEYFEDDLVDDSLCQFEHLGVYPSLIRNVHHQAYKPNFTCIYLTPESSSTAMFSETETTTEKTSEITTWNFNSQFQNLYKQFRALECSTNISNIIGSRLRYIFFTTRVNRNLQIKIEDYIVSLLHEAYESEEDNIVEKYSEFFHWQRSFPGVSEFTEFLLTRDDSNPDIAEALCREPICCFKKIQYKLELIKKKFLTTHDIELKCQWLNSLSKMFCYWILQIGKSIQCDGECNENNSDVSSDTPIHHIPSTEISQLGVEIDFLCDILIMEDSSPFVLYQILQHYQMGAIARMQKEIFIRCYPLPSVFQLSLFSLSAFILETLCGFILRINAIHSSLTHVLKSEEVTIFQASCNDIKKVFMGGSYIKESTYLAKTKTFKKLIQGYSEFLNAFILHKHPALFLAILKYGEKNNPKSVLINPESRREFFSHLAENGCKDFVRLINKIK